MTKNTFFKNLKLSFDRSFSSGLSKQIIWLVGIMAIVYLFLIGLSYITSLYIPLEEEHNRWYNVLFQLVDPGEGSESMTPIFSVLVAMIGLVIFGGMLISVMSNILERRVESYTNGETDYKVSDHVVIIGFNKSVPSLINKIYGKYPESFILLMSNKDSDSIRDWLHSCLDNDIEENVIVINGVQTAKDDINRLCLNNKLKEIYILGEEDDECHDANNLKCVELISSEIIKKNDRIKCHVQINSNTTYSVLQRVDFGMKKIDGKNKEKVEIAEKIVFQPFNFNEIWAQKVLATSNDSEYKPLDADGITCDSQMHVHLILIGANEMAISIAVNAAQILHFPNFKDGDFSTSSQITFIDTDIQDFANKFRLQYRNLFELCRWREINLVEGNVNETEWIDPFEYEDSKYKHLGKANFLDIQWEFISGNIYDERIQKYLIDCAEQDDEITTIALCSDNSELNASLCLALPEKICKKSNQILVRQKESKTTIELIKKLPNRENVEAFGMITECYSENLVSDTFGMIINGLYNEINIPNQEIVQKKWDNCSILNKWSSIYCANMLYVKLRSLGLIVDGNLTKEMVQSKLNDSTLSKALQYQEHNRWTTEKLLLGFAALTEEEQNENMESKTDDYKNKKSQGLCHFDICSNAVLDNIDPGVRKYDKELNDKLWDIYQLCKNLR